MTAIHKTLKINISTFIELYISYPFWWPWPTFKVKLVLERSTWKLYYLSKNLTPTEFKLGIIVTSMSRSYTKCISWLWYVFWDVLWESMCCFLVLTFDFLKLCLILLAFIEFYIVMQFSRTVTYFQDRRSLKRWWKLHLWVLNVSWLSINSIFLFTNQQTFNLLMSLLFKFLFLCPISQFLQVLCVSHVNKALQRWWLWHLGIHTYTKY